MSPILHSIVLAFASAALVHADNVSPVVPENAQIGELHFPVSLIDNAALGTELT